MTKGTETRERILDRAVRLAALHGIEGLSLGMLAESLEMSKSGLFAHFGSKEDLQVAVLHAAGARFADAVLKQAYRAPRGLPRLRAVFERWLAWVDEEGGCLFIAAASELDDHEGRPREALVSLQRDLLASLARSVRMAIDAGHIRGDVEPEQLAFELYALVLGTSHGKRLLRDKDTDARAHAAFERLLASVTVPGAGRRHDETRRAKHAGASPRESARRN